MSWDSKKDNCKDHKERVKLIFEDLVANYISPNESGLLFVRVEHVIDDSNNEVSQQKYTVGLSVFTPKIYEYDKETILRYKPKPPTDNSTQTEKSKDGEYEINDTDKEAFIKNYRPFFVYVLISISKKELNELTKQKNQWLKAEFHEESINGCYPADIILLGGANARPIIDKKNIKISNGPCIYKGKDINDLTKEEYDINEFNKFIVATNAVTTELSNAWSNKGYRFIDIYNVGHGNADYIVCKDNKRILYDIGAPYRVYSLKSFPRAEWAFSQLKPALVIISHWDADHYMGCGYASDDVFSVKWIAPQFIKGKDDSINLFRLVAFLIVTGKLMLIDINNAGKLVASSGRSGNTIKLLMGSGKGKKNEKITKKNRKGLYIELGEDNDKISVLAGDVSYNSVDSSIFSKQLTFLHVPHHCSSMDTSGLQNSVWGEEAVISTNNDASGKPDVCKLHQQVLSSKFKHLHYTSEQQGKLLSIRLCKSGKVKKR